jgi:hypothetical protein
MPNTLTQKIYTDTGKPFVLMDHQSTDQDKPGMLITTTVCDNPECMALHMQAWLIDEACQDISYYHHTISYRHRDSGIVTSDLPPLLEFTLNLETETIEISRQATPTDPRLPAMIDFMVRELGRDEIFDTLRRRWRILKKIPDTSWQTRDWSDWKPGDMLPWSDVYPHDFQIIFQSSRWGTVAALDQHCINPDCSCKNMLLLFVHINEAAATDELGILTLNIQNWQVSMNTRGRATASELRQLWQELQELQPGIKDVLQAHFQEMKKIGPKIAELSGNWQQSKIIGAKNPSSKIGRNDPCPCGSGKKFKKCCLDKK